MAEKKTPAEKKKAPAKSLADLGALTSDTPEVAVEVTATEGTESTIVADAPVADAPAVEAEEPAAPVNIQPEAPLREQQLEIGRASCRERVSVLV